MSRRRQKRRPQGFSEPGFGPVWNLILSGLQARGKQKRHFFNHISGIVAVSIGIAIGLIGFQIFGVIGGLCGVLAGTYLAGIWLSNGRFFR